MPSGEIVITLRESQDNTTNAGGPKRTQQQRSLEEEQEQKEKNEINEAINKKERIDRYIGNKIVYSTVGLVKQGWSLYQHNVGRWTGDIGAVHSAQMFETGLEIAGDIAGIATAAAMGSVVGPAGAIVAGATQALSTGVKYANKAINYKADVASNDRSVLFAKMRAGGERNNWSR